MSYIGKRAALVNESIGLSPFVVVYLTEEDLALIQQDHKDLLRASLVSPYEVESNRTKLIV